jgi:hypothetical protein
VRRSSLRRAGKAGQWGHALREWGEAVGGQGREDVGVGAVLSGPVDEQHDLPEVGATARENNACVHCARELR